MAEGNKVVYSPAQPGLYARVAVKLGIRHIGSDLDLASMVEKRIPATAIRSLVQGGLTDCRSARGEQEGLQRPIKSSQFVLC